MKVIPKPVSQDKEKKEKKERVAKVRIPAGSTEAVAVREAMGVKYGAINKDSFVAEVQKKINECKHYAGRVEFGIGDVETWLDIINKTLQEAEKTAHTVLTSEDGAELSSITIWTPQTNATARLQNDRVQRDPSILIKIEDRKSELSDAGASDAEIEADEQIAALRAEFEASKKTIDNAGTVVVRFKQDLVNKEGKTKKEVLSENLLA